ncbi:MULTISPECIES: MurR/RpiR family transcriptional regulator [unclassified Methylobacterium]|jgi:DNA-binding MurR/RpiR family transcriptional regulator|uniref:MurR/RpiR family transcriptional regulator n=1 Tax=unclassified Methylobacterium TaxID=2615210 RepID=UPI0013553108|nr:MurR/RpiR family transcriptional regulator [Methylobacterium sp. 2A]MWV23475.1 MurR/RpiR family transcriptional regulator [Methylobacterium sp. 2A]
MEAGTHAPRDFHALRGLLLDETARLPKRLRQAADFVASHPDEVALGTVAEVATHAGVQPSTLVRLAQSFGYGGYSEMQLVFRARLKERWPDYQKRLEALKGAEAEAGLHLGGVADAAIASVTRLRTTFDPAQLERAADLLAQADTVYLIGARRVFPVVSYLVYAFAKMSVRCQLIDQIGQMGAEQIACARATDAVLAVSFTPYTPSTVDLAAAAARAGVPVLAITDSAFSPLVARASLWLEVAEADYGAFRSLSATMVLAMTLAIAVGERHKAPPPSA